MASPEGKTLSFLNIARNGLLKYLEMRQANGGILTPDEHLAVACTAAAIVQAETAVSAREARIARELYLLNVAEKEDHQDIPF